MMDSVFVIESWPDPPEGQPQQAAIRAVSSDYCRYGEDTASEGPIFVNPDSRIALPLRLIKLRYE